MDRNDYLDNSRPLDVWRRSDHPVALAAAKRVAAFVEEQLESTSSNGNLGCSGTGAGIQPSENSLPLIHLPSKRGGGRKKFNNHLVRVLWDLAVSQYDFDGTLLPREYIPWIAIKLSGEDALRNESRYNKCHWKPPQLGAVVDVLEHLGLILKSPYKHVREGGFEDGTSFTTRILGTNLLWDMLSGVTPCMIERDPDEELVILVEKINKKRNLLEYEDTLHPEIPSIRENLAEINSLLSDLRVSLSLTLDQQTEINNERLRKGKRPCDFSIPPGTRMHYARIFQDGFTTCGRFYGPWFQNIPAEARPYLKLEHKPTTIKTAGHGIDYENWGTSEIDFSSLHPVLLYAQAGINIATDPYTIPGYEAPHERNALKLVFQLLINCKSLDAAKKAARKNKKLGQKYVYLIEPLIDFHAPIKDRFFQDGQTGKELQLIDSNIAEQVLLNFGRKGFPCLTIHDSFITWDSHESMLTMEMDQALWKLYPNFKPEMTLYKVKRSDGSTGTKEGIFTFSGEDDFDC